VADRIRRDVNLRLPGGRVDARFHDQLAAIVRPVITTGAEVMGLLGEAAPDAVDLPVDEIGKNRSGSADRQAASCHYLPSAISRIGTGRSAIQGDAKGSPEPAHARLSAEDRYSDAAVARITMIR